MKAITKTILVFIIILLISIVSVIYTQNNERSKYNMSYISEGYCYNKSTKIIYMETYSGHGFIITYFYTPYYNENGELCKYNTKNGDWIPIRNK